MSITRPAREELPPGLVSTPLPVERVLYEAEYPVVYVTRTMQGQQLLAYVADESAEGTTTLLAPISDDVLLSLERGALGVREALGNSWLWLHVFDGERGYLWPSALEEIPASNLPVRGTPLLPRHEPVLRTRAVGESVVPGRMPASVVVFVADATRRAFKALLDLAFASSTEGRSREEHRALYDLPIQQFAFASFELGFGAPHEELLERAEVRKAVEMLQEGLAWADDPTGAAPLQARTDEERAAILRAVLLLTPPASGPISEVHVSGMWVRQGRVRLTRASRRQIREDLRRVESETLVSYLGRIGQIDVDNLSFILRDTEDGQDRRGIISENDLDDVLQYIADGTRVAVTGVERQGRLYVAALAPAQDPASDPPGESPPPLR